MKATVVVVYAVLCCGCAVGMPATLRSFDELRERRVEMPRPTPELAGKELEDATTLVDATRETLESARFARNLIATRVFLAKLALGPNGAEIEQSQAAAMYLGQDPAHRVVPSTVDWSQSANRTVMANTNLLSNGHSGHISIGKITRERWADTIDIYKRSCAINTLAHEMAHLIPEAPGRSNASLFVDRGRWWATFWGRPLGSYVFGAVAQCTYLELHGIKQALSECVEQRGINDLMSRACEN